MDKDTYLKAFNLVHTINALERELERIKKGSYVSFIVNSINEPEGYFFPREILTKHAEAATIEIADYMERELQKLKNKFDNL